MTVTTRTAARIEARERRMQNRGKPSRLAEEHVARAEKRKARLEAKLRALESKRPAMGLVSPSPENLRLQKAAENRVASDTQARAKAERENDPLGAAAALRRIERAEGRLAWLEANPTLTPADT